MKKFLICLMFASLASTVVVGCGKKKKGPASTEPPISQPLPNPPPPVDPGSPNGSGNYPYCGAIDQNYITPYSVPGTWHYDPQYNVDWFITSGIATYWYAGYYWFYGDCNSVAQIFLNYNIYYNHNWMVQNPTPCYNCKPNYPKPTPTPQPNPPSNNSGGCGKGTIASFQQTHSFERIISKNDSVASDTFNVPVTQDYYIEVYALYSGVTQKNETFNLTIENVGSQGIRDLNDQTNPQAPKDVCPSKCYIKVCLSKGTHTIRFKGTNQPLWLKNFTIRTSKPNSQSCN